MDDAREDMGMVVPAIQSATDFSTDPEVTFLYIIAINSRSHVRAHSW
jgi:hypothetical protein